MIKHQRKRFAKKKVLQNKNIDKWLKNIILCSRTYMKLYMKVLQIHKLYRISYVDVYLNNDFFYTF